MDDDYYDYTAGKPYQKQTRNNLSLNQEHGNVWGSEHRSWHELAKKDKAVEGEVVSEKEPVEVEEESQTGQTGKSRVASWNDEGRENFSEFIPNFTLEDVGKYKQLRGQLLTQMIQKEGEQMNQWHISWIFEISSNFCWNCGYKWNTSSLFYLIFK